MKLKATINMPKKIIKFNKDNVLFKIQDRFFYLPIYFHTEEIQIEYVNWLLSSTLESEIPNKMINQKYINNSDKTLNASSKKLHLAFKQLWLKIKAQFKK